MISVVLQTLDEEEALVGTLASLVSGAADGAVREVIVVDGGHQRGVETIADGVGCTYIKGAKARDERLAAGADAAKGPWLLFLAPGVEMEEGWFREARQFIEQAERSGATDRRAATFRVRFDEIDGGRALWRHLFGQPAGRYGLLIHCSFYRNLGGFRHIPAVEYVDIVRRIGATRLKHLRSQLFVPERGVADRELGSGFRRALGLSLLTLRVPTRVVARLYS